MPSISTHVLNSENGTHVAGLTVTLTYIEPDGGRKKIFSNFETSDDDEDFLFISEIKKIEKNIVRSAVMKTNKRIDGRGLDDVRAIDSRVNILENVHGSALFTRGETQALVSTTLGTTSDEQLLDTLDGSMKEKFPPYITNMEEGCNVCEETLSIEKFLMELPQCFVSMIITTFKDQSENRLSTESEKMIKQLKIIYYRKIFASFNVS